MGIISFASSIGMQLSILYCLDAYKDMAAEALVTVILIRNTMSFAIGYGITPWISELGLKYAFAVAAAVSVALGGIFLVCTIFGKRLRRCRSGRYFEYVHEAQHKRTLPSTGTQAAPQSTREPGRRPP